MDIVVGVVVCAGVCVAWGVYNELAYHVAQWRVRKSQQAKGWTNDGSRKDRGAAGGEGRGV